MRAYEGTGFGQKYRMHPLAAALARQQLKRLDSSIGLVDKNVKAMNQHLDQLEGITEPRCRPDQQAGLLQRQHAAHRFQESSVSPAMPSSRRSRPKAWRCRFWDYPEQHKLKIYSEAKWWHHPPTIPPSMPGNAYINANHIFLPAFYGDAPELIEQYVKAFQKVWAHRAELARL